MNIQEYLCEECNLKSSVQYESGEDVFSVINKIEDDHKKHSPDCTCSTGNLKIINNQKG